MADVARDPGGAFIDRRKMPGAVEPTERRALEFDMVNGLVAISLARQRLTT